MITIVITILLLIIHIMIILIIIIICIITIFACEAERLLQRVLDMISAKYYKSHGLFIYLLCYIIMFIILSYSFIIFYYIINVLFDMFEFSSPGPIIMFIYLMLNIVSYMLNDSCYSYLVSFVILLLLLSLLFVFLD